MNSYNSFLKRHINLEINEIKRSYSKITIVPAKEKIEIVNNIAQSFDSGDALEPVRYISSLNDSRTESLLVEEAIEQKKKLQVT